MEWQVVQRTVGHNNEVLPFQQRAKWSDEFAVERFEVALRCAQERFLKPPDVFDPHAKLRELKAEQLQEVRNSGKNCQRKNFDFFARYDSGNDSVTRREVLDEGCIFRKTRLQFLQRKIRGGFQGGIFPLLRRKLTQRFQQLFLVSMRFLLQIVEPLVNLFLGAELFELDTVVIPVEFLAQVSDLADEITLARLSQGKTLPALKDHFDHAARFGSFNTGQRFFGRGVRSGFGYVQIHKRFVDLHSVLDKGDFQLFALQSAAQRLQRLPCFEVRAACRRGVVASLCDLSFKQVRLIGEHGCLKAFQPRKRFLCFSLCFGGISDLQSDAREQQVGKHCFSGERGVIEKSRGRDAKPPCFKVPSFVEK